MGLEEALMAETKVRRAGALNCFANGERRALENVREAMMYAGADVVKSKKELRLFVVGE